MFALGDEVGFKLKVDDSSVAVFGLFLIAVGPKALLVVPAETPGGEATTSYDADPAIAEQEKISCRLAWIALASLLAKDALTAGSQTLMQVKFSAWPHVRNSLSGYLGGLDTLESAAEEVAVTISKSSSSDSDPRVAAVAAWLTEVKGEMAVMRQRGASLREEMALNVSFGQHPPTPHLNVNRRPWFELALEEEDDGAAGEDHLFGSQPSRLVMSPGERGSIWGQVYNVAYCSSQVTDRP
jgi:hypothetical protein